MKDFYEVPTMVSFLDPNYLDVEELQLAGIAYRDEIICGCCGGIFKIEELKEEYNVEKLKFEELSWINIVDAIRE